MKSSILSGLVLVAALVFMAQPAAVANPLGGVVAAGSATISQSGAALTINQNSSHAIINWGSFNISAGESTSFHFLGAAGANSVVLNEVSASAGQSFINGLLNSYVGPGNHVGGTVYIYNPNGILFGSQGSVNVGSLIGTTLSLGDSAFMKGGNLTLGGPSVTGGGSIQNQGQISALDGDIFLIAHNVENDGALTARNVGLAAGSYVEIKQPGQPGADRISVLAGDPSDPGGTGVNNSSTGLIKAVATELQAAGGNVYALAVNNAGAIHADTLVSQGGHIYLTGNGGTVQNSGTLDASDTAAGGTGGSVTITGSQITLTGTSTINANGEAGGGAILIGGGSQGKNPGVPNATDTTVETGASLTADAITQGNGGKVVVWSDDTTTFAGQISARGGANGGNGGSAEVSGAQNLSIIGHADLMAPSGRDGTLLLDPGSVTIVSGPNEAPPTAMNTFNDGWINNQLDTGSSLTIDTANSTDSLAQDLTVQTAAKVAWNSANNLTLNGANSITVNGTINSSGSGGLFLNSASGNIAIFNSIGAGTGGVSMIAADGINLAGALTVNGPVTLNADSSGTGVGSLTLGAAVSTGNSPLNISAGGITFNAGGSLNSGTAATTINATGGISIGLGGEVPGGLNISDADLGAITAGELSLNTIGAGTVTVGGITLANSANVGTVSMNSSGVTFAAAASFTGAVDVATSGDIHLDADLNAASITLDNGGSVTGLGTATATTLTLEGAGSVGTALSPLTTDMAGIVFNGNNGSSWLNNGTGAVNLSGATGGSLSLTAGPTIFGATQISGNLALTASGAISQTGSVTVGGTTGISTGGNAITLNNVANDFAGAVTVNNSGANDVSLNNGNNPLIVNGAVGGNLSATGAGISDGGSALSVGGATMLTAGTGNPINFGNAGDTFSGAVTVESGDNVTLVDTAALAVNGTVTGNLTATGAGIGDGGSALTVGGATMLTAGTGNPINFGNAGDTFSGAVTVESGDNVTLVDTAALAVNGTVTGNLTATGAGIGDGGSALTVGGTTSLTAGAANPISFANAGDAFTGAVTIQSGDNVTLVDTAALAVNGTVTGNLTATGAGIGDGGSALTVGGTTILTAGAANPINFANPGDTFSGAVTVESGDNVTLVDTAALAVNGTVTGNLTATGAGIGDGGSALTVGGATMLTAGTGNPINFGNAGDTFSGAVTVESGDNVTLVDTAALAVNGTVTGNLTATGAGIGDGGSALTVGGTTILTAGAANPINFANPGDTFTGAVTIQSGDNVTLVDTAALAVNGTVTGNLTATGAGIGDGGSALTVGGTTSLTAGPANPISFANAGDTFTGAVTIQSGDNVTLSDTAALAVNGTVTGNLTATGAGIGDGGSALTVGGTTSLTAGAANPINFANAGDAFTGPVAVQSGDNVMLMDTAALAVNGTVTGNLTATGAGIGDGGSVLTVGGTTSLTAGAANPISFANAGDAFTGVMTIQSGDNVTLVDTAPLAVSGIVSGNLSATGAGIRDGGSALTVGGTTSLTAGTGNNISFQTAGDSFAGAVSIVSGNNVTLDDVLLLTLNGTVSGNLNANANGIDINGALTVNGFQGATLNADPNNTGSYDLTIGGAINTTAGNGPVNITAADMTIAGGSINSGSGVVSITASHGGTIGLGAATGDLTLTGAELANITTSGGLSLNTTGGASISVNGVSAANSQNVTGPLTMNAPGGTVSFVASPSFFNSLVVNANVIDLNADVTTAASAGQAYNGAVTLSAPVTLAANNGGSIAFSSTIDGAQSLDVEATGAAIFNGAIGSGTKLASLTVDATDTSGLIDLNGGAVSTTGAQNYGGAITLEANTVLTTTTSAGTLSLAGVTLGSDNLTLANDGAATLNGAVNGTGILQASGSGALTIDNTIAAGSVMDGEATTLNGAGGVESIATSGNQTYTGSVTLGANTTLNGAALSLAAISLNNDNLTLNNSGTATLNGAVTGTGVLQAGGAGNLAVGNTIAAGSVIDSEATTLGGGTITTTGSQSYTGNLMLAAGTTLTAGTTLAFGVAGNPGTPITLTGNGYNLTLDNTGVSTLNAAISGVGTLTATGGGLNLQNDITAASVVDNEITKFEGAGTPAVETVMTTGSQNYSAPVLLFAATTLSSTSGGNITLGSVVSGAQRFEVETTGTSTFEAPVNTQSLIVDQTDNSGTIDLNGGAVTTSAGQIYDGAVELSSGALLSDTAGSAISFGPSATIIGGQSLEVETGGTTTFGAAVNVQRLIVDRTDPGGTIDLNGGAVTTSAGQLYGGAVELTSGTLLTDTGGSAIIFGPSATISGAEPLEVETAGSTTLDASVNVKSLTVDHTDTGGTIALNGGAVTTTGGQSYDTGNLISLGANTKLTSGTTLVLGSINGNGHSLTIVNGGPAAVNGTITDVSAFNASTTGHLAKGNLTLNGNITTTATGSITILEDTTFTGPTTLTFDTLTLGRENPKLEAEFYGPGPVIFDNTGEVNLAYGSLESITSILFENPQLAFLPGLPGISLQIPLTELYEAEGTAIRSAFDLAEKTVVKAEPIQMEVDMRSPSVAGSHLLRSGQLYRGENLSPSP